MVEGHKDIRRRKGNMSLNENGHGVVTGEMDERYKKAMLGLGSLGQ